MKCQKCQFENRPEAKFCEECGARMRLVCPRCGVEFPSGRKFCGECGYAQTHAPWTVEGIAPAIAGERKQITVIFSDLSGYTRMTEKLDPEDVKEIVGRIFAAITQIVKKYDGTIGRFLGDAAMILFGFPNSHEDDAVRAIRAAREIHTAIEAMSPDYQTKIGGPLAMHTGINSGLVVISGLDSDKAAGELTGDTVNVASRLCSLTKAGSILVGSGTHHLAQPYFTFKQCELLEIKGKAEPIEAYELLTPRETPEKIRHLHGLQAKLVGRESEMTQFAKAVERLQQGQRSIISICGDPGTGKTRLAEEFRATLDRKQFQWMTAHCYGYTQNIPYFPLIDLLNRAYQIHEGDPPEQVKLKVERGSGYLIGDRKDLIFYIGSLYSIKYPEIKNVSPEYWKARLYEAIQLILANLCKRSPTIICIEDLHWADPSSVELLRNILSDFRHPAVFLCIYRPTFNLFTRHQAGSIKSYHEIRLQDLSPADAQCMVESLLKTEAVPNELKKFIREKVEGNPFYLEEVINSLLETATLISQEGAWILTESIMEANIPSTVQAVISARLDRLENETKRILQEASVIGRAFLYDILKRITELKEQIDKSLIGLEQIDLIRTKTVQPDLEYIFKHAITQEVVYNGLLKKERHNIHETIGQAMEELFKDRLPEFYEALAYHYKQGYSTLKAADYLMKAGEKSLSRYALDEAHQYYKEAFEIIEAKTDRTREETMLLVDILLQWAVILYRRCHFIELVDLLKANESVVVSLDDKERIGMFYARLGGAMNWSNDFIEAHAYLNNALEIGEQTGNEKVLGYAYIFLPWCCTDLGMLDEAVEFGRKAQELNLYKTDADFFRHVSFYIGYARYFRGDVRESREIGNKIIEFAEKYSRLECLSDGYLCLTFADLVAGDFISAIENAKKSCRFALDPLIKITSTTILGMAYAAAGKYQEAQTTLEELTKMTDVYHSTTHGTVAKLYTGIIKFINGSFKEGISMIENVTAEYHKAMMKYRYVRCNHILGQIYSQLAGGEGKTDFSFIIKNIGFLIKTVPFAYRKAESYFYKAIETAEEIGAKGALAQAYLDMGRLRQAKGKTDEARKYISDAVQLFEECEADVFLKQAKETLASLAAR